MNGLPPVRPAYQHARALYIEVVPGTGTQHRLRAEPVRISNGRWMVQRDGRLVPLGGIRPLPAALQIFPDGHVEAGDLSGWWGDLPSFLRANGIEPASADAEVA